MATITLEELPEFLNNLVTEIEDLEFDMGTVAAETAVLNIKARLDKGQDVSGQTRPYKSEAYKRRREREQKQITPFVNFQFTKTLYDEIKFGENSGRAVAGIRDVQHPNFKDGTSELFNILEKKFPKHLRISDEEREKAVKAASIVLNQKLAEIFR